MKTINVVSALIVNEGRIFAPPTRLWGIQGLVGVPGRQAGAGRDAGGCSGARDSGGIGHGDRRGPLCYKIRSITTQSHGKKSSSFFGASPPKNAKNLIKIARARTSAASLFGALPPRRGQEGQKGARRPSVSEHMHPLL